MYQMGLWILLITGFATGFLACWVGLLLVNIRPSLVKVTIVAMFYSGINLLIRSIPLSLGGHFIILTAFLSVLIMVTWKLKLFRAIIATVVGMLILILSECICVSILGKVFSLNALDYLAGIGFLKIFIPQLILLLTSIIVIDKRKLHILDFKTLNLYNLDNSQSLSITVLTGIMFLLLLFQFIIITHSVFLTNTDLVLKSISSKDTAILDSILMIAIFITVVLIIHQLLVLSSKENRYLLQLQYLDTLSELYTAIKAEGHDRINHLQTLYGFVQLGDIKETRKYLEDLMGDIIISHHYAVSGNPGLSALFYIKAGIATSAGIQLNLNIRSAVKNIGIPSYELNRIIGNLINNAFDAVNGLPKEKCWVNVDIYEKERYYVFTVSNYGSIDLQIQKNIYSRGFTTKEVGHNGLGLYIIRQLVEKYGGKIMLVNRNHVVQFTIYFPMVQKDWDINTLSGSKTMPMNGDKLGVDN
jgi:two-component system sensor histidine kinase AgrC